MKKRVLITRQEDRAAPLILVLREYGIESFAVPVTETVFLEKITISDLDNYNWITFTSVNGVSAFCKILKKNNIKLPDNMKIGAVGEATASAIAKDFRLPDIISDKASSESLAKHILKTIDDPSVLKILWPCGQDTLPGFPKILEGEKASVERLECYKTEAIAPEILKAKLQAVYPWEAVFFAAPSAVHAFSAAWDDRSKFATFAIGHTTAEALHIAGYENIAVADGTSVAECVKTMLKVFKEKNMEPK